MSVRNRC